MLRTKKRYNIFSEKVLTQSVGCFDKIEKQTVSQKNVRFQQTKQQFNDTHWDRKTHAGTMFIGGINGSVFKHTYNINFIGINLTHADECGG